MDAANAFPLAVELCDRALAIAVDGALREAHPAVAYGSAAGSLAGKLAWDVQRAQPTQVSTRHYADLARDPIPDFALALIAAELRERFAATGVDITGAASRGAATWLVAPAALEPRALGAVFGIARQIGLAVAGFVDGAVLTAAALDARGAALVVELGLHDVAVSSLECGERVRRRRSVVSRRGGLMELYEAWLQLVSAVMVKRTRFDPLHEGATEQQLFAMLPALARAAATTGAARAALEARGERFEVELSRDQLAQAAQPIYRELLRLLHDLRPAGARLTLAAPALLAELPGLPEELESFGGCDLVLLPDGFAAVAATRLLSLQVAEGDTVRLLRSLPRTAAVQGTLPVERRRLEGAASRAPRPSHVLHAGRAFKLGEAAVDVGRGANAAAHGIALPEGLAGVSRRHCSFVREGSDAVLVDHSRFGTWLNGERVAGRVRLHAGDRVRIGDPGVELDLIAVDGAQETTD
jgi:hypothetical protein